MPRLTYSPEGVDPTVWDFKFDDLLMPESIAICKASGLTATELGPAFIQYDPAVVYATFQVLARRHNRDGKALQPRLGELTPDFTPDEWSDILDASLTEFGRDPAAWSEDEARAIQEIAEQLGKDLDEVLAVDDGSELDSEEIKLDDGSDTAPEPEAPKA